MSIDHEPKRRLSDDDEIRELVTALNLNQGDLIVGILLVAKVQDHATGGIGISMAATDEVNWIDQLGMIKAAEIVAVKVLNDEE